MQFKDKARFGWKIVSAYVFNKKIPISVTVSITDRCNFDCSYCSLKDRNMKEMTTEQALKMIDEFAELGTQRIGFVGGEPYLRKDIKELLQYAKKKNMLTSITTNGSLIKHNLDILNYLDTLIVSIDGIEEVQKEIRKSSTSSLLNDIKLAEEHGVTVWSSTVLTKQAIKHFNNLLDLSRKNNLKLNIQPVIGDTYLSSNKEINKKIMPSNEELKIVFTKAINEKRKGALITNSYSCLKFMRDGLKGKCLAGRRWCFVDTNGDVYPCSPVVGKLNSYNGCKLGFKNAFMKTPDFSCKGCSFSCCMEYTSLFSLKPSAVFNIIEALK